MAPQFCDSDSCSASQSSNIKPSSAEDFNEVHDLTGTPTPGRFIGKYRRICGFCKRNLTTAMLGVILVIRHFYAFLNTLFGAL
jgi:hypothetical protein